MLIDSPNWVAKWDEIGSKKFESGVSHVMLYKLYNGAVWIGVPWNGVISIDEKPDGADEKELWADNIKYGSLRAAEKFGGSIEAYTYPEEFRGCDGLGSPIAGVTIGQQKREKFCLAYVTDAGNDQDEDYSFKLHLVYNATCKPSDKSYKTRDDNPDAITFSWDFDTTPVAVTGYKPTSLIVIDSKDFTDYQALARLRQNQRIGEFILNSDIYDRNFVNLLDSLYGINVGQTVVNPILPTPSQVLTLRH